MIIIAVLLIAFILVFALYDNSREERIEEALEYDPSPIWDAGFADDAECERKGLFDDGIRIGYSRESGRILRYGGESHLITFAPTGVGKSTQAVVPALLDWPYSAVVVDVKGELCAITHKERRRFGKVFVLNPFNILPTHLRDVRAVCYNPMDLVDPRSPSTFGPQAAKLGSSIVWQGADGDRYWDRSSRQLVQAMAMALAKHAAPHERNLGRLAEIINGDVFGFSRWIMRRADDGFLRQKLARFAAKGAEDVKSLSEVIENTRTEVDFISEQAITDTLRKSDFHFADLKREVVTVYVCLPLDVLEVCGKFFRLILGSVLSELLREDGLGSGVRTLVLMDEFFQLGRLEAIQNAMGMARGFQTQLWCVLNDMSQLQSLYGRTAETFMNNAGVRMWLAARDEGGSRYVSEQCGDGEARSVSKSIGYAADTNWERVGTIRPHVNVSYGQTPRKLILPHEVRELNDDEMILFVEKVKGAIFAKRKSYFAVPEMNEKAGHNPYFKGHQAKRDGRTALRKVLSGY